MKFPQFSSQPNAYTELARQALFWAIGMGFIHMTTEQQAMTLSFVSAALAVVVWKSVVPVQTVEDAGHTISGIKNDARVNNAQIALAAEKAKEEPPWPPPPNA